MKSRKSKEMYVADSKHYCEHRVHRERTVCGTLNSLDLTYASFRAKECSFKERSHKALPISQNKVVKKVIKEKSEIHLNMFNTTPNDKQDFVRVLDEDRNKADSELVSKKVERVLAEYVTLNSRLSSSELLSNKLVRLRRYGFNNHKTVKNSIKKKNKHEIEASLCTSADSDEDESNCDVNIETSNSPNKCYYNNRSLLNKLISTK
ncbi:unnamed protein product [Moneuplotes crassus]|uniref:Uncharacterized protein n=1 Tax=Euplotes crassus TaxID=5936 RepID=A0AAD1XQS1_EUPCR|nr:unnamed protein product [Moneuplotes crassus]